MEREIYEVDAKIVDASGNFSTVSGFPKIFDSASYNNSTDTARRRAYAAYHTQLGSMYAVDNRPLQIAMITRMSDGVEIEVERDGDMPEVPDTEE